MTSTCQPLPHLLTYWIALLILILPYTPATATDQFSTNNLHNYTYQTLTTPITLSKNDKRHYEGLILSNHLEVLLISDKEVDRSAAALTVKAGSQMDTKSLPGLAHLCEHLLFMGNKKYPNEEDFDIYMQSHSGNVEAYTDYEDNDYIIDVSNDALDGALDRFSQNFISPLFKQDSIDREVQVIDSEYKNELQNDIIRIEQVLALNSNPDYPYSNFITGNSETLSKIPKSKGIDVRKELIKFYKSYYSSNRMKLVVIGKEPLSELRKMVIPRFSQIPNLNLKNPIFPGKPFTDKYLGIQINIVPVEDSSSLTIEFPLPPQQENYYDKPIYYLSSLLNQQGPGSLNANFKQRGWVMRSSIDLENDFTGFFLFKVEFELTPIGYSHYNEIIELTFSYLKLIKEQGIDKKIFNEINAIHMNQFQYLEKEKSRDYAYDLAQQLHSHAPMSQIISSKHIIANYNASLIHKTMQYLNPQNIRVILVSPSISKLTNLKKETNYGTQFTVNKIRLDTLKIWESVKLDPSLKLPESNPFLPKNFNLIKVKSNFKFPVLLKNETRQILWYTTGGINIPKVSLRLIIKNNPWFQSPNRMAKLELFKDMVLEELNSVGYMALQAGLNYEIKIQYPGIAIKVEGFSDKADKLMIAIVNKIRNFTITQGLFNMAKEKMAQAQMKFNYQSPYNSTTHYLKLALKENFWANDQLATVTNQLTMKDLIKFQNRGINRGNLELMVLGNFEVTRSHNLMDKIQSILKLQTIHPKLEYTERTVIMKNNTNLIYTIPIPDKDEINSAIGFYLDMYAHQDAHQRAIVRLIAQMIQQPAFHQLRTNEQLGYIVLSNIYPIATRGGIVIIVQSERDPSYLESRIESMLSNFVEDTTKMSKEDFRSQVKSLHSIIQGQQRNLKMLSDFYWDAIISGYADFQRDVIILKQLESLTQTQFLQVVRSLTSPNRRKLSIHLIAHNVKSTTQLNGTVISDLLEWRQQQPLSDYPLPIPTTSDVGNVG